MSAVREDFVSQGSSFLVNKEAQAISMSDRVKFLENKGLNTDEILAAVSRAAKVGIVNNSGGNSAFLWDVLLPNVLVLGAGAVVYYLCGEKEMSLPAFLGGNPQPEGNVTVREVDLGSLVADDGGSTDVSVRDIPPTRILPNNSSGGVDAGDVEVSLEGALAQLLEQNQDLKEEVHDLHLQMQILLNAGGDTLGASVSGQDREQHDVSLVLARLQSSVDLLLNDRQLTGPPSAIPAPVKGPASVPESYVPTSVPASEAPHESVSSQSLPSYQQRIDDVLASVIAFVAANMRATGPPTSTEPIRDSDNEDTPTVDLAANRLRLKGACLTLQMYLDKIAEVLAARSEQDTAEGGASKDASALLARYRKISTNNQVFGRSIRQAVVSYEAVLVGAGFERRVNSQQAVVAYEYAWLPATAAGSASVSTAHPSPTETKRILQVVRQSLAVVLTYCERDSYDTHHDSTELMEGHNRAVYSLLRPGNVMVTGTLGNSDTSVNESSNL